MGRVLVTRGARAAEAALFARLDPLLREAARDPSLLASPIRVVVPSGSLRDHLLDRLVSASPSRRRACAGITVQTLFTLAAETVERAGEELTLAESLFEVLAQREGRREAALRARLEGLVDGYAPVVGSIRDLIDAGLEPAHAEAAEEALRSDGASPLGPGPIERAVALVRAAARTSKRLERFKRGRRSSLLRRATELLSAVPGSEGEGDPLPARAIFIHGFADATGLATDLIHALLRYRGAEAILDLPPQVWSGFLGDDPSAAGAYLQEEASEAHRTESAFTDRFAGRLLLAAPFEKVEDEAGLGAPSLRAFETAGTDAEVREAARRVHLLLDQGTRPESIGVVARDLAPYRFAIARHFGRLGLPFHAPGTPGARTPSGRRLGALLEILELGEATPTDRWLDALGPSGDATGADLEEGGAEEGIGAPREVDLRLALLSLGAARLRDVAALPAETLRRPSLALPIQQGLGEHEGNEGDGEPLEVRPTRRVIASRPVRRLVQKASRLRRHLEEWPRRAPFEVHLRSLRTLLSQGLGWRREVSPERELVDEALEQAAAEIPPHFELDREELRTVLRRLLREKGTAPLGGKGGGIQVLSVTEARSRTFERLFVLGLQRNSFPRVVRQDPLFPDDLRIALQGVLPDIPRKLLGYDEERYLFAQLLSASPEATLSWQYADEDGKPKPSSPLVDPLRRALAVERLGASGPLRGEPEPQDPKTAGEQAIRIALAPSEGREAFARLLPQALAEARGLSLKQDPPPPIVALAGGRMALLDELDPDLRTAEGRATRARLGPYFGFVGPLPAGVALATGAIRSDPRRRPLYITHLERLAGCPWQLFLERLLGIEAAPDPSGLLPRIDPSLLGRTVHAVLEAIGKKPLRDNPERPVPTPWPAPEDLATLTRDRAGKLLASEGIYLSGFAGALARQALPYLEVARRLDWSAGPLALLDVEADGIIQVPRAEGRSLPIHFRGDRIDLVGSGAGESEAPPPPSEGTRRWTDYKTGRPLSESKKEETRRKHFLAKVRAGSHLQAVAYLLTAEGTGGEALGRYLYLDPEIENDEIREVAVGPGDLVFREAFDRALASLLDSWEAGSLFPRLVELNGRQEPPLCGRCAVAEACLRGDSGARRRLFDWTLHAGATEAGRAEAALLRTWRLAISGEATEAAAGGEES